MASLKSLSKRVNLERAAASRRSYSSPVQGSRRPSFSERSSMSQPGRRASALWRPSLTDTGESSMQVMTPAQQPTIRRLDTESLVIVSGKRKPALQRALTNMTNSVEGAFRTVEGYSSRVTRGA